MYMNNNNNYNHNSYMNLRVNNINNSFNNENNKYLFKRNQKLHKSFFAGDKFCFNKKFTHINPNPKKNGFCNSAVELEMLLSGACIFVGWTELSLAGADGCFSKSMPRR